MELISNFSKNKPTKKGNAAIELILVILLVFGFATAGVILNATLIDLNTEFQNDTDISTEGKALMQNQTTYFPTLVNDLFLLAFFGLWIIMLITAWYTDAHPIFFIFTAILLVFVTIIGMTVSNTYQEITSDAALMASADMFPNINLIMDNLGVVVLVMGFSVVMVLFGKNRYG